MTLRQLGRVSILCRQASIGGFCYVVLSYSSHTLCFICFLQKEGFILYFVRVGSFLVVYLKYIYGRGLLNAMSLHKQMISFDLFLNFVLRNPNILFLFSMPGWDLFYFGRFSDFPFRHYSGRFRGNCIFLNTLFIDY